MIAEPTIDVGIVTAPVVEFEGSFDIPPSGQAARGTLRSSVSGGSICIACEGKESMHDPGALLTLSADGPRSFAIHGVTIGKKFHWERKEDQRFTGALRLVRDGKSVVAVNVVPVEEYLSSVIASEMSASGSMNLLKAQAIASRSWLLAQLGRSRDVKEGGRRASGRADTHDLRIRWYEREEHALYDVCADDHCQRYQGVTVRHAAAVQHAVGQTRGRVIMHGGEICDARFSKCCGGITEPYAKVWQPVNVPYLVNIADVDPADGLPASFPVPDVSQEALADRWIRSSPPAFCGTADGGILSRVLVRSDQDTADFYRWNVDYAQEEIAAIVREKSGTDFGAIIDLVPVERGPSGRLTLLKIVGEKRTMTIGRELEIRRTLSPSHLYSSAFVVDRLEIRGNIPEKFVLTGAGWGHGVGLCQIGAAVMGERGYSPESILSHYFPGTAISKIY